MFKVFLVEDEIVMREGIRKNIQWEQYGFEYAGDAPDGELALPLIRQIQPDLLITDIKMPFMDGLALSELVRKELPLTKQKPASLIKQKADKVKTIRNRNAERERNKR